MIISKSITFRLLSLIAGVLAAAALCGHLLSRQELTGIMDRSQHVLYAEKLETIMGILDRTVERLKITGMQAAYEEGFKDSVLENLRSIYYKPVSQQVYPFIIDSRGYVVMHPQLPRGDRSKTNTFYIQRMLQSKNGDFYYAYHEGEEKWCIFRHFREWDWIIGYSVGLESKYADVLHFQQRLLVIVILITGFALVLVALIVTAFTRPIIRLTEASSAMAAGDLNQPVDTGGKDELGVLARSFDRMRVSIRKKIADLAENNEELQRQIAERGRAEAELKAMVKEKEILLQELYHRTKNNIQVISSLLTLQAACLTDPLVLTLFRETKNRIHSMALVHELLYQSKNLSRIHLGDCIEDLANGLLASYHAQSKRITLHLSTGDFYVLIDTAVPCGLVINELVSNSLKYAFPGNRKGEIRIMLKLTDDAEIELVVGDNGIGLPGGFDFRDTNTLGMQLVVGIVERQLGGTVELKATGGTEFRIKFKEIYDERV